MRSWSFTALSLAGLLVSSGCDFSGGGGDGTDNGGPGPPNPDGPLLIRAEPSQLQLCAGEEIRLIGRNFSPIFEENQVTFIAGVNRIAGVVTDLENTPAAAGGTDSTLTVMVPGGISAGNVELQVEGISAGAVGYEACPQILTWTLGRTETDTFLRWEGPLGFRMNASFVNLYGINFNDIEEVTVEAGGQSASILSSTLQRGSLGGQTGGPPTGYSRVGFELHDALSNDVRVNVSDTGRTNLRIRVRGPSGTSNPVDVPVFTVLPNGQQAPELIGATINGVKLPTGVRSGPVRIYYTVYDIAALINYRIDFFWSVDGGATFFPARSDPTDPENDGNTGIVPGSVFHRQPFRLFPGGGALRTFTWDAPNDPEFQRLNQPATGPPPPRSFPIQFRIQPTPEPAPGDRVLPPGLSIAGYQHEFNTPTMLYYSLEDRPNDDVSDLRAFELVEEFKTTKNQDKVSTSAIWGPPRNDDALSGEITTKSTVPQFGSGTAEIVIKSTPIEEREPDTKDEYLDVNTDTMTLVLKQISSDNGTPCDPVDDVVASGAGALRPIEFDNPGKAAKEFHLATLTIEQNVKLIVRGPNPLVLRLRGKGSVPSPSDVVFRCAAGVVCDLAGCDGEESPRPGSTGDNPGRGGKPGPGGGEGGTGASLTLGGQGAVKALTFAEPGDNSGGGGGETTANWDYTAKTKIPGGPGGGGGNREPGGDGDAGRPAPTYYLPPEGGRGGSARGDGKLVTTAGSGGGGGGAGVQFDPAAKVTWVTNSGAGGGGGGGVLHLVAAGSVDMDPSARIRASGGKGGIINAKAASYGGPGGGGSGGMIFLQASGSMDVSCDNFEVLGGIHGTGQKGLNDSVPGAGDGGAGWIRLESTFGGAPTCTAFSAETTLTKDFGAKSTKLEVAATTGFPDSGAVVVGVGTAAEEIGYKSKTALSFEGLTRTVSPLPTHVANTPVVLKSSVSPIEKDVLSEGKVTVSPDQVGLGRGRDAELQLPFEPTIDPITNDFLRDPETQEPLSLWFFDTDKGEILRPDGSRFFRTAAHDKDPGLLDLTRLTIPGNTVLRGIGSRAVRIQVTEMAEVAGWIDVSGSAGGLLIFEDGDPAKPTPGLGGPGGPGGGDGGGGGYIEYASGDAKDESPANTIPVPGEAGGAPVGIPDELDRTAFPYGNGDPAGELATPPQFTRATPGGSVEGESCADCKTSAGGGAGGGNLRAGLDGKATKGVDTAGKPLLNPDPPGKGGSALGFENLRFGGQAWQFGGTGGSGGGGSPHVSLAYKAGIPGSYRFKQQAVEAPGTGGGGGGGVLHLSASNVHFYRSARLRARGGDAFQSIDLGGNGGGGAGGTILVQVANSLTIEQGALFDVSGGRANQPVPILAGQKNPEYEGNVRPGSTLPVFLGEGGDGSPGRIRLEAEEGSAALLGGVNSSLTSGPFLIDTVPSKGVSRPIRLGVGPGGVATSHDMEVLGSFAEFFEFGQPSGTDSTLLWEGAAESLDQHGAPGTLEGMIRDPTELRDREFLRFTIPILSNRSTQKTQTLNEVRLDYRLNSPSDGN